MNPILHHYAYLEWHFAAAFIGLKPLDYLGDVGVGDAVSSANMCITYAQRACKCGEMVTIYTTSIFMHSAATSFCTDPACRRPVCAACYTEKEWYNVYHETCPEEIEE